MWTVIEMLPGNRAKVIGTEFQTKANAQNHIAAMDPAGRRDLHVMEDKESKQFFQNIRPQLRGKRLRMFASGNGGPVSEFPFGA